MTLEWNGLKKSVIDWKFNLEKQVLGEYLSQIDSILRVKLKQWLSKSSQFDLNILQLLGIQGRILDP